MEKCLKRKKEEDANIESDEEQPGPSTAKQVTVKFKSDDKWKERNENSYKALKAKSEEEAWIECTWHNKESTESGVSKFLNTQFYYY